MLLTGYACVKDVDVGTATCVLYSVGIAHWNDQRNMVVVLVVLVLYLSSWRRWLGVEYSL
jgi:hypothetical protein